MIQIWSFKVGNEDQLWLALVVVNKGGNKCSSSGNDRASCSSQGRVGVYSIVSSRVGDAKYIDTKSTP